MDDFDFARSTMSESAQRVVDRAFDEARRRHQTPLTAEHLFYAFTQVEWRAFSDAMTHLDANPDAMRTALDESLGVVPSRALRAPRMGAAARLVLRTASQQALRFGRRQFDAADLFTALFADAASVPVSTSRSLGLDPQALVACVVSQVRDGAAAEAQMRARLELPSGLKGFATNLNLLARQDAIAPVSGREHEIRQVLEILCHRERSNSAMLVGEPGVGKTAVVEGLARRIELHPDSVPSRLRECQIVSLHMNTLVAGTMLRGMFEERVQGVIREIVEHPNLILFVDEAHMLVGAGSALGAPADAANMFKSVLARGTVRMIGATTLSEYTMHIQDDEALARRFRVVLIEEPTQEQMRLILRELRPRLERNYSVRIDDDALDTALDLSQRYQRHLHLPDKVIGWLDTAAVRAEIARRPDVRSDDVVAVIAETSRIPKDMVFRDITGRFASVRARLRERVVGQDDAVEALTNRLVLSKGPLKDGFVRPDGVLLFLGPTGVGKTELAKGIADFLFGDERKMIRLDMSEYQDVAAIDRLIGASRGVAGSDRGGVLTNQLRDHPCSVVLLDEIEKASPTVLNLFLQAFDEGWVTDGRGRRAYLSDALVIMTSNIGSERFHAVGTPFGFRSARPAASHTQAEVERALEARFSPEFRNRIDQVVVFRPLEADAVRMIAGRYLDQLAVTLERWNKAIVVDPDALDRLVAEGHSRAYGARFLKRVLDERVKLPISYQWKEADSFRVRVRGGQVVVDPCGVRTAVPASADVVAV